MRSTNWLLALLSTSAVAAAACGGSGAGRMSVAAKTPAATVAATGGALDLGGGIALARVRLAVASVKLEGGAEAGPGATDGDGSGGGHDDGPSHAATVDVHGEVAVGPFAVDLSGDGLAGGVRRVFDTAVPAGAYRELAIEIAPAGASLAAMGGRSVIVDGTIDAAPFTFSSSLRAVQRVEGAFTVAADGASSRVTRTVDPHGWFAGPDRRLDPTSDADRAAIEASVAASIHASRDDD